MKHNAHRWYTTRGTEEPEYIDFFGYLYYWEQSGQERLRSLHDVVDRSPLIHHFCRDVVAIYWEMYLKRWPTWEELEHM